MRETLSWKRFIGVVMVALTLQGCLLGPEYRQPDLQVPENWNNMTLEGNASSLAITVGNVPEVNWWRAFGNDELNTLIEAMEF